MKCRFLIVTICIAVCCCPLFLTGCKGRSDPVPGGGSDSSFAADASEPGENADVSGEDGVDSDDTIITGTVSNNTTAIKGIYSLFGPSFNAPADYKINQKTFADNSHDGISIRYPQLSGSKRDFSVVNRIVVDKIHDFLDYDYGNNYNDLSLDVDDKVTLCTPRLLSIVFEGNANVKTAAHPQNVFFTLNIDLENASVVKLTDFCSIDSHFISAYKENWYKQTDPVKADALNIYSDDELTNIFKYSNTYDNLDYYYLTKKQLGISLCVPHAIGDHVETLIDYQEISSNLK